MTLNHIVLLLLIYICRSNCYPQLDGRIVGGTSTNIWSFPFQLSFQYKESHICGASILNERYAITAAHCVVGKLPVYMSVYAGSTFCDTQGVRIRVAAVKAHKSYNNDTSNFDIAIIKLSSNLPLNHKIKPVDLPVQNESFVAGTIATVSGWGYTKESGTSVSPVLQKVDVPIVDRKTCRRLYSSKGVVTNRMLCAGAPRGGRDACQGDSGGPLTANGKLIGVVSWGYGCARPGYPGVYTRVAVFVNWITRMLVRGI